MARTFSEKYGLQDKELSSKEHDEILMNLTNPWHDGIWHIYNSTNLRDKVNAKIMRDLEKLKRFNDDAVCDFCKHKIADNSYSEKKVDLSRPHGVLCARGELIKEVPLVNKGYAVGFLDAVLHMSFDYSFFFVGETLPQKKEGLGRYCLPIEVKTHISSFGETLRQINWYQEYLESCGILRVENQNEYGAMSKYREQQLGFLLIACGDTFKSQFEEEGITYYDWNKHPIKTEVKS